MNTKKPRQFFNRLSARSLALVLVSLGIFASVLALLLTFGLGEIMRVWHEDEQSALHLYVADTLVALQKEAAAKGSNVAQSDLVRAFEGLPFAPDYLVVTKADGSLLYYYKQAERGTGQTRMALRNLKDI
ncbi:MAG: hypothetical protein EOM68_31270 [Spirochaetia bacterium]|nr:hypothetical protein [Spirochaetia bacterium]